MCNRAGVEGDGGRCCGGVYHPGPCGAHNDYPDEYHLDRPNNDYERAAYHYYRALYYIVNRTTYHDNNSAADNDNAAGSDYHSPIVV